MSTEQITTQTLDVERQEALCQDTKHSELQVQDSEEQTVPPVVVVYEPTDDEVSALKRQISIYTEQARALLLKHDGDQVKAILEFYNCNYKASHIGIADTTHAKLGLTANDIDKKKSRILDPEQITSDMTPSMLCRTYLYVILNDSIGFTKKKKFCNLPDLLTEIVKKELHTTDYKLYELTGQSNEILEKWNMPESAIVFSASQVFTTDIVLEKELLSSVNKQATQLTRHSGIIGEKEVITGPAVIIGNVEFPAYS
jgi:hypothetical protein